MQSGRVVLRSLDFIEKKENAQHTECEYDAVFDKDRIRFDRKCRLNGSSSWGTTSKYALANGIYIEDLLRDVVVEVDKLKGGIRPGGFEGVVFHPNVLGLFPGGVSALRRNKLEDFANKADREDVSVTEERSGDQIAYAIQYRRLNGVRVSVLINPAKGYAVESIEEMRGSGTNFLTNTEVTSYKQYGSRGIWYPRESTYERTVNGEVRTKRVITVIEADFENQVESSLFTIAGFDLKDGRVVSDNTSGIPVGKVWKSGKLVDLTVSDIDSAGSPSLKGRRGPNWILWGNAFVCALLAVFLLRRHLRTKVGC